MSAKARKRVPPRDDTPAGRIRAALTTIRGCYDDTLDPVRLHIETHALAVLVNPPLPVSAVILDVRLATCETLDKWFIHVRTARKLKVGIERWDVDGLVAFLLIHAAWLADTSDGPKATAQLEHCSKTLKEIAQDSAPRRFNLSRCVVENCPGVLRVTLRNDADSLPSEIRCTLDPAHRFAPGTWRFLGRNVKQLST